MAVLKSKHIPFVGPAVAELLQRGFYVMEHGWDQCVARRITDLGEGGVRVETAECDSDARAVVVQTRIYTAATDVLAYREEIRAGRN